MAADALNVIDHNGANVELNMAPAVTSFDPNLYATHAAGAAAVVTVNADNDRPNVIRQIWVGHTTTPAAGSYVQIEDGSGTVVWKMPLTAAGPFTFTFELPKGGTAGRAMIVTASDNANAGTVYLYADIYKHK